MQTNQALSDHFLGVATFMGAIRRRLLHKASIALVLEPNDIGFVRFNLRLDHGGRRLEWETKLLLRELEERRSTLSINEAADYFAEKINREFAALISRGLES